MRNKDKINIWVLAAFLLFSLHSCAQPSQDEQVYKIVLQNYCSAKNKDRHFLQSTSTQLPKYEKLASFGADAPNEEAFNDMYNRNKVTASLPSSIACKQLEFKSEEKILEGFNTKPKLPHDITTDENWAGFAEKFPGITGVVEVSVPGYSKDEQYSIIYMESACGSLCGGSNLYQFKKVNDVWMFDKKFFVSQS